MARSLKGQRAAIYARYSSDKQRSASIDDQVRRCREFIEREGMILADERIFTDEAISGSRTTRPGLDAMMAAIVGPARTIDVIVTEDVSRVSRNLEFSSRFYKALSYEGVPLIGVADGIDTSGPSAKMTFTLKALMSDMYLDELADKTRRGLEGRHRAGFATGLLPYGFRSTPIRDRAGRVIGHDVEIDEERAEVVRRIFAWFAAGWSLGRIARQLNADLVPPPRKPGEDGKRRPTWIYSALRQIVRNEKYAGEWIFNKRRWVKHPTTERRVPRDRPPEEWMRVERPELRIVDAALWEAVRTRIAQTEAKARSRASGSSRERDPRGRPSDFLLTGLLRCGACGGPMNLQGPVERRYYRCSDRAKRGTCANTLTVREEIARTCILDALRKLLVTPTTVEHARRRFAEKVREWSKAADAEVTERRARLARTEERIGNLVAVIADGERSERVRLALRDLEAQAAIDKEAIETAASAARGPFVLPSPDEITDRVFALDQLLVADVHVGRAALKRLLRDGYFDLHPGADGVYVAKAEVLPLAVLLIDNAAPGEPGTALAKRSCGGRI